MEPLFPELREALVTSYTTGVLPSQKIAELIAANHISAATAIVEDQVQPASIDLRLGPTAYRVRASFLPNKNGTVLGKIREMVAHEDALEIDLARPTVLEKGRVYIVPILEELRLPADISGKANPKSTTGRLDVFTRLITDYGAEFEKVPAGYKGRLYVEVFPRTFSIVVRAGDRLNQLRLVRGSPLPSDSMLNALHHEETLVYLDDDTPGKAQISRGLWLSVDLQGGGDVPIIGYKAKLDPVLIDLAKRNHYSPFDGWDVISAPPRGQLILEPEHFYLLASKERIRIPPSYAAEMIPYDPSFGEFRVHYAGFFDPGFGYGKDDIRGTQAVLEVRSHGVPFLLEDGQRVGRLVFERLLDPPTKLYGLDAGSSYQNQGLWLSKQFRRLSLDRVSNQT